ncbi:MAG: hypothetical protein GW914_04360, partial [Candidatus Aenigmarchaeota archaeon]|nr:hypothetical protein [Candidatus Aenigmarchaeota archaeon]NCO96554.1 hypothetical protein [Candidatus Aenigmarchaeota archaeon]
MVEGLTVLENLANSFITPLPNILGALILLLIGVVIGKIVGSVLLRILKKFKADGYFKLEKGPKVSEIFSTLVKWIIYLAFISASLNILGIQPLTQYFENLVEFIVGILGGTIIIVVAYLIARYFQNQVKTSRSEYSKIVSQIIFFFIMVIAISIAFDVANIPNDLINIIIIIVVGAVGLGVAIALGFGLKDTVARLAKKYENKF